MLDRVSSGALASRKGADRAPAQMVSTGQLADQTVSDPEERWFADICDVLLPKDAGLALHTTTDFEERTCYRYAAGDRKPPGYFIRALLRSREGQVWLNAIMDGSDAPWWRELQGAVDLCARYKIERRS